MIGVAGPALRTEGDERVGLQPLKHVLQFRPQPAQRCEARQGTILQSKKNRRHDPELTRGAFGFRFPDHDE
jgi:hypothetical protein